MTEILDTVVSISMYHKFHQATEIINDEKEKMDLLENKVKDLANGKNFT
jgi:hypothetical protein